MYGNHAVILVTPAKALRQLPGVELVPIGGNRALIALEGVHQVPRLELDVRDAIERNAADPSQREALRALAGLLRDARLSQQLTVAERTIIVLEYGRRRNRAADRAPETADGRSATKITKATKATICGLSGRVVAGFVFFGLRAGRSRQPFQPSPCSRRFDVPPETTDGCSRHKITKITKTTKATICGLSKCVVTSFVFFMSSCGRSRRPSQSLIAPASPQALRSFTSGGDFATGTCARRAGRRRRRASDAGSDVQALGTSALAEDSRRRRASRASRTRGCEAPAADG